MDINMLSVVNTIVRTVKGTVVGGPVASSRVLSPEGNYGD